MSNATLTLKPITDLLGEGFYIPAYQRGYRWTARQVAELLDDICAFHSASDRKGRDAFYCLQPVVVTGRPGGDYELIDGQQRLTTIYLILTFLLPWVERLRKSRFGLQYETRPGSGAFLRERDLDLSRSDENIDYYHICEAYRTIERWFAERDGSYETVVLNCLLNSDEVGKNVKVIWYELPGDQEPVDAFIRLNIGKIPLTNAELIRALFLRSRNFDENDVHLKQLQIAQEWDGIEKTMQADDFWCFLYGGKRPYPTRIEYLFELITADTHVPGILEDDPYRTFLAYSRRFGARATGVDDRPDAHMPRVAAEWRKVKQYFMTCEEWFRDRALYHLVGYLVTQGIGLGEIRQMSLDRGKSGFQHELKRRAFADMFDCDPEDYTDAAERRDMIAETLAGLSYETRPGDVRSVLLLFNVATLLQNGGSNLRFPFDSYKKESWDIEHICSVRSEKPGRVDAQRQWLRAVLAFLTGTEDVELQTKADCETPELRDPIVAALGREPFDTAAFDELYERVLERYGEDDSGDADHRLQNLALLDAGTNRSYKNAVFPVKRRLVLALDKAGTFAPLCTTNVFLKYYSTRVAKMMSWTKQDREDYFQAIVDTLTCFFAPGNGGTS